MEIVVIKIVVSKVESILFDYYMFTCIMSNVQNAELIAYVLGGYERL